MLIIEDGSIVPGADSFVSAADFAVYAANYGVEVPDAEPAQEALLRRAAVQLDGLRWAGAPVSGDQALSWPRSGVVRNGFAVKLDAIPAQVKQAQMALAAELHAEDVAAAKVVKGAITKEAVDGAVTREYAAPVVKTSVSTRPCVALLTGFLGSSSQIALIRG